MNGPKLIELTIVTNAGKHQLAQQMAFPYFNAIIFRNKTNPR
jgi:hypothetical protein